ncbi:hypothetical protein HDU92_004142 [Lobulomyces angularis]|nr:hypothetical protein HDU92_004142 [Lobulomyces angularis]
MGYPMAKNLILAGYNLAVFDVDLSRGQLLQSETVAKLGSVELFSSAKDIFSKQLDITTLITVLPNDKILKSVLIGNDNEGGILELLLPNSQHISCSTISPQTARELHQAHKKRNIGYVASPIFARPDGMAAGMASLVLSGDEEAVLRATEILKSTASVIKTFGNDPGAANVVKLCGNYLIGSAIEALSEACALAEANGVDRVEAIKFYTSTFFDCAIYKGYGQRVSERDHKAGGFALELGLKDMTLVRDTAYLSNTPMPFLSVLVDRFLGEKAKGRSSLDWSAIGLGVSELSGVNVCKYVEACSRGEKI